MNLKFFNCSQEEIFSSKSYNIFIGISVGVKPLDETIAKSYISWALENSSQDVVILIADEIAKFNYIVFSNYNESKSLKRAYRDGNKHIKIFENTILKYFQNSKDKINIIRWRDIITEEFYEDIKIIQKYYEENRKFKERIDYFIDKYTQRRNKKLNNNEIKFLSQYIIFELPTILKGIKFENKRYNLLFYPTYVHSGLSELCENIFNEVEFLELKKELNLIDKTALVEAYIDE